MRSPSDWPSLQGQLPCAASIYGDTGASRLADWLAQEEERVGDPVFARLFSDYINLPGVASIDYAHRHVTSNAGSLIGDIRFYAQDIARPFVEIIAHDFDDMIALAQVVSIEWRAFAPQRLRLLVTPGAALPAMVALDMSVYAARYSDLIPPPQEVQLNTFDNPYQAMGLVRNRFDVMAWEKPTLRCHVSAISFDTLTDMYKAEQVHRITAKGQTVVGLIAVTPGQVGWITGDEIIEEVIAIDHSGHGYAAAAQYALSRHHSTKPDTYLIGTIDSLNAASRRSAERAGRRRLLDYVFLSLEPEN